MHQVGTFNEFRVIESIRFNEFRVIESIRFNEFRVIELYQLGVIRLRLKILQSILRV